MSFSYNTSPELWRSAIPHYQDRGIFLVVVDGHIVAGAAGIVARFDDDKAAIACLEEAGYMREKDIQNIVFRPPVATWKSHPKVKAQLERYGEGFFKKLPLYKTCVLHGRYWRITHMDVEEGRAELRDAEEKFCSVPVMDLESFVL